jgi:hypothetical protein
MLRSLATVFVATGLLAAAVTPASAATGAVSPQPTASGIIAILIGLQAPRP